MKCQVKRTLLGILSFIGYFLSQTIFRCILPIKTLEPFMARHFFLFLEIFIEFLLTTRNVFFYVGRTQQKMIRIFLTIELDIAFMGRPRLKIGI